MTPAPSVDLANRALLGFAVAVVPLLAVAPPVPRGVLAVILIGVAPGYALVRPLRLAHKLVVVLSTFAVSLGASTLVSTLLLYCRVWSWPLCAGVLALITAAAVVGTTSRRSPA